VDAAAASMLARELAPIPLSGLDAVPGAGVGGGLLADFPGCAVPTSAAAYACSQQVFDFLASNVLRNADLVPVIRSGWVVFDRSLGTHSIPLDATDTQRDDSLPGDLLVPDTQALIVTSFTPFAALNMPGLPGSFIGVDPFSLVGQVAFSLIADNGSRPLVERTVSAGDVESGTEIVNAPEIAGNSHPPYTDVAKTSLGAAYKVFHSPFPGYPSIVGVRLRGYMVNQQLLAEALDNKSYQAGG
jgi:hypothetical protein